MYTEPKYDKEKGIVVNSMRDIEALITNKTITKDDILEYRIFDKFGRDERFIERIVGVIDNQIVSICWTIDDAFLKMCGNNITFHRVLNKPWSTDDYLNELLSRGYFTVEFSIDDEDPENNLYTVEVGRFSAKGKDRIEALQSIIYEMDNLQIN